MTQRSVILVSYAEWTAMSAVRSKAPVRAKRDVYPLLRGSTFSRLLGPSDKRIDQREFDKWHEKTVSDMIKKDSRLVVGWAAKLLNVYLKTYAYVGDGGRPGLRRCLHPPIDGGLWRGIRKRFGDNVEIINDTHCVATIAAIDSYRTYQRIIGGLRRAGRELGCSLFEVEQLWIK